MMTGIHGAPMDPPPTVEAGGMLWPMTTADGHHLIGIYDASGCPTATYQLDTDNVYRPTGRRAQMQVVTPEQQEALAVALEEAALRARQTCPDSVEIDVEDHVDRIDVGLPGETATIPGMRSPRRRRFNIEW